MALAYRLDAISQGPKKSRSPGPNPLPLALVMDAARIKIIMHYAQDRINHRCIDGFMYKSHVWFQPSGHIPPHQCS